MSGYLLEDIRIENAPWRMVDLVMKKTEFSARQKGYGSISNVTIRDVTVNGAMQKPNTIAGHDANHRITGVLFENVKVDGKYFRSARDGNFRIDPDTTADVCFKATAPNR
jgi:hypothetical protein